MNIAIVGASGAVGAEFLRVLEEQNFPVDSLRLFGSARSAGTTRKFRGQDYVIEELTTDSDFSGVNQTTGQWLVEAGADVLVAGSAVFKAADPQAEIAALKALSR